MKHPVDILNKVQKVEAPPFLYARVLGRIQNKVAETVPVKWAVVAAAGLLVLITINITVIQSGTKNSRSNTDLSEVFSLKTSNSLYNE